MRRKLERNVTEWLDSGTHEPLLVKGARRVGKTHLVTDYLRGVVGEERHVYLDFQTDLAQIERIFEGRTDIDRIVSDLSAYLGKPIFPESSILVFDEVQLCEKALNSLRFFAKSPYRVIATGSLLGVALKRNEPVNKAGLEVSERRLPFPSDVIHVTMHPLDFEEFLWALGREPLAQDIRRYYADPRPFPLHDEALSLYRQYLVVGGMPKAVCRFAEGQGMHRVRQAQAEIDDTYVSDMPSGVAALASAVWNSVPQQLARESSLKFKYGDVVRGGRAERFAAPLDWLEASGIVSLNRQTNGKRAPLVARDGGSFFKLYMADTGLMYYKFGLSPDAVLSAELYANLSDAFRGALAENYAMQALVANGVKTFYWTPGDASGEVEFVTTTPEGAVLPIEVKSGTNVRSLSLRRYAKESHAPLAIRVSARQFGREGTLKSVPLYAMFCIGAQPAELA